MYVIEHGDVWYKESEGTTITSGLRHVCDGSSELAVAFQDDRMLKLGSVDSVRKWFDKNAAKYIFDDESSEVQIVSFPICQETVDEMNNLIRNSNRIPILFDILTKIGEKQLQNKM